jgi:hypothetical protein
MQFLEEDGCGLKYICRCGCEVSSEHALVWEGFMGANVPALLFRRGINIDHIGPHRRETLSTGTYLLVDVVCRLCRCKLGWRYLEAEKEDQKYKVQCVLLKEQDLTRINRVTGNQVATPFPRSIAESVHFLR